MTGSEGYRKRALGVYVDGAHRRSSSTKLSLTETCRGLTGRRCPFWLGAQCLTRRYSGRKGSAVKRRATLIGGSSEIWPDKALLASKAKPYHNGGVTLFVLQQKSYAILIL